MPTDNETVSVTYMLAVFCCYALEGTPLWQHVTRLNLTRCESSLHRLHRIPTDEDIDPDPGYLFRAARFLRKSFDRFDTATGVSVNVRSGFDALRARLVAFDRQATQRPGDDPTAATEADTK